MPRAGGGFVDCATDDPALLAHPEYQKCESPIERAMLAAMLAALGAGTKIEAQAVIGPYRVDFLVADRIIVECDGFDYHSDMAKRAKDIERTLLLERIGYQVLRFWGQEIDREADRCALQVMTLALRQPTPGELPPIPPGREADEAIKNILAQEKRRADRLAGKREPLPATIHLPYRPAQ